MDCSTFLNGYSDFRDDRLEAGEMARFRAHLAGCAACARYHRVIDEGVALVREMPAPRPTDSFLPRLQHRIYTEDERRRRRRRLPGTLTPPALALVAVVGGFAILPVLGGEAEPLRLPAVVATAPGAASQSDMPSVFGSGPFFTPAPHVARPPMAGYESRPASSSAFYFDRTLPMAHRGLGQLVSD
jgi:anti-sigma factor RsiW